MLGEKGNVPLRGAESMVFSRAKMTKVQWSRGKERRGPPNITESRGFSNETMAIGRNHITQTRSLCKHVTYLDLRLLCILMPDDSLESTA